MKKIFILFILSFSLVSCNTEEITKKTKTDKNTKTCLSPYKLDSKISSDTKLKGTVIASENNVVVSPVLGKITYLNCIAWKTVYPKTLIAKITPDYNDPNIKNLKSQKIDLNTQKINLQAQIANIRNNKVSTSNSFDIQIANVDTQISSVKSQIDILKKNIENTEKTGKVNLSDLDVQINSLKNQISILKQNIANTKKSSWVNISDLEAQSKTLQDSIKKLVNQREILKKSEKTEIEKLEVSKNNMIISLKNTLKDNFKIIDEIFWVTKDNRDLNDKFQDYLSAENISYKLQVEKDFLKLFYKQYKIDEMSDSELSVYINDIINLNNLAWKAVNTSIDNVYFTQTRIDGLYKMFLWYSNNLANLKTSFDNFPESKKVLKNNFENQINSLENVVETSKNNLANLEKNKRDSVWIAWDVQVLNLESQLKTLESNLKNLEENKKNAAKIGTKTQILNQQSQLKSLESNLDNLYSNKKNLIQNKKTSLSSLDNQVSQLKNSITWIETNIKAINTNLSPVLLYSWVTWKVKQKFVSALNRIWPNVQICSIEPSWDNFKIKIFSPIELNIWTKLNFEFDWEKYETSITNVLSYKDQMTKNFVYESDYIDSTIFKTWEVLELKLDKNFKVVKIDNIKNIPVSYVINRIEGKYLKVEDNSKIIERKVETGDISWDYIEIISDLKWVNEVCK